jgi:hypothetical protein
MEFQTHEINFDDLGILKNKFRFNDIVIQLLQKI